VTTLESVVQDFRLSRTPTIASPTEDENLFLHSEKSETLKFKSGYAEPFQRDIPLSSFRPYRFIEECKSFGFKNQPRPWFPQSLKNKIERLGRGFLRNKELVTLLEEIAEISIDFYEIKSGQCIAIRLDGKIVESAENEFDLLIKIQGLKFDTPVFVWKAGSKSFAGWNLWQR
jgi:hypothetical protein